jgi:DNA/RNA endonuclease YhcR with UshA esterase domain
VLAVAALSILLAVARVSPGRAPVPGGGTPAAPPAKRIAPADAGRHEGEEAMVCGLVAATRYAAGTRGSPTFLDFGAAYPGQVFQVVIWGSERSRFHEAPEQAFLHKQVCVTGRIRLYRGKPEITVKDPAQLALDKVIADPDLDERARSTG